MSRPIRRHFLRRGGLALSGGLATFLAGCTESSPRGDPGTREPTTSYDVPDRTPTPTSGGPTRTDTRTETETATETETWTDPVVEPGPVSFPETGPPRYRRWVPEPSRIPYPESKMRTIDEPYVGVRYVDLERIRDLGDGVPPSFGLHRRGKLDLDHFGVGFENYRRMIGLNGGTAEVVEAALDPPAVAETLTGTGYDPAGDHRGYRLFAREDDPRAVAVGDDALVFSNPGASIDEAPLDVVRTVVDAGEGAIPRYHEVDEEIDRLWETVGGPPAGLLFDLFHPIVWTDITDLNLDGMVGGAVMFGFDADATYLGHVFGVDRDLTQNRDRARTQLRNHAQSQSTREFREFSAVEVEVERRLGSVLGRLPDDRYAEVFGGDPDATFPQVTWSFDHERHDGEWIVTATHEGGDEVPTDSLGVSGDGELDPPPEVVRSGDTLTVRVGTTGESHAVSLVWHPGGLVSQPVTLGHYEFP